MKLEIKLEGKWMIEKPSELGTERGSREKGWRRNNQAQWLLFISLK